MWKKARFVLLVLLGAVALWTLGDAVINGSLGGVLFSRAERIFKDVGLIEPPLGEGLSLEQIRSERRFEDGGMHLVVDGVVRNATLKTLPVPDIQAKAIGPDRQVIQSWRIEAPAATLPPGATAPFHSSIISPEGAVVEINMSFAERDHD